MPVVQLTEMRDLLLPGLLQITGNYERFPTMWEAAYGRSVAAPHIWVPKLSLPQAALLGAAAAIIKNPEVTRRFWAGWLQ